MNDVMEPYLLNSLPLIDILVLDEADRMVADGHFKEMHKILEHIYTKRVQFKREARSQKGSKAHSSLVTEGSKFSEGSQLEKQKIFASGDDKERFRIGNNLVRASKDQAIDLSKVVDLDEEENEQEIEQILQGKQELVIDRGERDNLDDVDQKQKIKSLKDQVRNKRKQRLQEEQQEKEEKEKFTKDYLKLGGIQHIICSATMTIDNKGRITPRQQKIMKKKGILQEMQSTLESLCNTLRFRSKTPKVIDLTEEQQNGGMMPATLSEQIIRCKQDEKDLYLYYFLQQKKGESIIIFCNAITATRRLTSLLDFLKIKNFCLHSKMQQKQRLKSLDRFKKAVNDIETGVSGADSAILVCTDVAARGLDIPNVANVVHYQCPFNAEVYVHRCGRTARIGRSGDSLSILNPEDNKAFRGICVVLKKNEESFHFFNVQYSMLEKIRPLIDQAKELEKEIHRK